MTLNRCCCELSDCTCCNDSCSLATSYTATFSITASTNSGATIPANDSCGDPYSLTLGATNMVFTAGGISGCPECDKDTEPPFTGNHIRCVYPYGTVSNPNWSMIGTSTAGGICTFFDCSNFSAVNEPGTTEAWANFSGGCNRGLSCVNEINTTTGLNIWYWVLRVKFTSTATVANGGSNTTAKYEAGFAVKSVPTSSCTEPTGLTWNVKGATTYSDDFWHDGDARGTYVYKATANANPAFPANKCWRPSGGSSGGGVQTDVGSVVSSLNVAIT